MEDIIVKECTHQKLSQAEKQQLKMWLNESARNRKIYNQMKLALLFPDPERKEKLKVDVWNDIQARLNHNSRSYKRRKYSNWYKVAAIFIFGFFTVFTLQQIMDPASQKEESLNEVKVIEKVSLPGQKVTNMLPDGTIVKLNSDSKILVPETFTGDSREIELHGEAFFEVVRNESKPFIIKTGDLRVRVLGTSFNIRSYPEEDMATVAVASGKVAVCDKEKNREDLVKGEKIVYTKEAEMVREEYDWDSEFGWKDNILLFRDKRLPEIIGVLKKWYGVEFIIERNIDKSGHKFSGKYHDPTLRAVLEGISFIYDFNYQINGKTVTIK